MTVCEKCWSDAGELARESGMSKYEAYKMILSNQRDVHELEDENTKMRRTLETIADEDNWLNGFMWVDGHTVSIIKFAKDALKELMK